MAASSKPQYVKAGYWCAESSFRPAANINTDYFTHIFCAFADLDPTTNYQVTISDSKQHQVSTFSATIKQKTPDVKTVLSIGGNGAKPISFALMAGQSTARKSFIDSSISLARLYNFDGLDLQWLHPSKDIEMTNLGCLLNEWRDAIVSESQRKRLPPLLLVATTFYSPYPNSILYPTDAMKASLDWINILAYDFYTPASSTKQTGPAAAFFNSKTTSLSGNYGVQQWLSKNFPSNNIVLGLPFHGWAWQLQSAGKHSPFSPTDGPVTGQIGVSSDGRIDYRNITKLINQFSATTAFDEKYIFNYAYYNTNWISYDDGESISAKISQAKKLNLLGYFVWHIGADDEYSTLSNIASQQWGA